MNLKCPLHFVCSLYIYSHTFIHILLMCVFQSRSLHSVTCHNISQTRAWSLCWEQSSACRPLTCFPWPSQTTTSSPMWDSHLCTCFFCPFLFGFVKCACSFLELASLSQAMSGTEDHWNVIPCNMRKHRYTWLDLTCFSAAFFLA